MSLRLTQMCLAALLLAPALPAAARPSAAAELGRHLFFDASLSASGQLSCASCHDPRHAYGPPDGSAVRFGGAQLDQPGARAVPSLRYVLPRTPVWHTPFVASEAERLIEGQEAPTGGFGWDGRFATLHAQAAFPLLAPNEMANASPEEFVRRLERTRYAAQFRAVYGNAVFHTPAQAFTAALAAIERFELEDPSFHPFSSRFDAWLDGRATLTAQELRGRALFDDPKGGNCASCHLDRKGADGSHPLFTDYQFEALGVPRNPELPQNADPQYFDLGVCGPLRTDLSNSRGYCGLFKTPGLRNIATRRAFFHNGRFHTLTEALRFYVSRDTDAQRWYPASAAGPLKFDDLPAGLRVNADVIDAPLTRTAGQTPVWSEVEIDAVIAFLETLTDRDALPATPPRR